MSRRDILHGICHEPEGMYKRRVWELVKTAENLVVLYDKVKDVPNFIRNAPLRDYSDIGYLLQPEMHYWMVDNVGVIVLRQTDALSVEVHVTFWDRRLRGREYLMKLCALRALRDFRVTLLYTAIPEVARPTLAFARRVGFQPLSHVAGIITLATSKRTLFTPSN